MKCKQAKPFAPFPLQKLHHYYGLACHRYPVLSLYACFPLRLTVQYRLPLFRTKPCIAFLSTLPRRIFSFKRLGELRFLSNGVNPGCRVNSNQVSFTLLTDTNVTIHHPLSTSPIFFTRLHSWFNLFSSTIPTYRDQVPVFPYRSPPREFSPNAA